MLAFPFYEDELEKRGRRSCVGWKEQSIDVPATPISMRIRQ